MAYTKHTWQARQGTDLSKFTDTISGETLNLVSAANITQAGTPISADWLNEMEQGIYDGNALIFAAAPTTSTVGAVGQIGVYNGDAYVCTAAANNVYTWIKVGAPIHYERQGDGNGYSTNYVDVYPDGRTHWYGSVAEKNLDAATLTAGLKVVKTSAFHINQDVPLTGYTITSVHLSSLAEAVNEGTSATVLNISLAVAVVTLKMGYMIANVVFPNLAPDVTGGTLQWYYDVWGVKNGN